MDPLAFRDDYRTAASATATLIEGSLFDSSWRVQVHDDQGKPLGTPAPIRFGGPFSGSGVDLAGHALLDREVVAPDWTENPDGTWYAAARSQRAA